MVIGKIYSSPDGPPSSHLTPLEKDKLCPEERPLPRC